jgi:CheY-like chemotaxis protein
VDDDENVLQITGEMLKILGYQFEFASSGNEALQKFKAARKERTPFLLVITDLTMPGEMGGTELLQRVKLIDPDIPVIVSSGYSNEPVISNPGLYGFSGSIVKPYQPSALGKTLQRFIQSD